MDPIVYAAVFMASAIQAAAGFGFALLAFPLLTMVIPVQESTVLITALSLLTNLSVLFRQKKHIVLSPMVFLIFAGVLGVLPGVLLLRYADAGGLKILISAVILLFTLLQWGNTNLILRNRFLSFGLTGLIAGVFQGAAGMCGPPVVLFLNREGFTKHQMRANLAFFGTLLSVLSLAMFTANRMVTAEVIAAGVKSLFILAAGTLTGHFIAARLPEKIFRKGTLFLILAACIVQIYRSFPTGGL